MTRMRADAFGVCRTPDGRTIPCNPPSDNGLAQLALMLRGSGWLDRNYAESGDTMTNPDQSQSANPSRLAYENNWAAMPGKVGPFDAGSHLPITKAQEIILPSMAEPWIETFPMYEPRPAWEFPPIPEEISPLPFEAPDLLKGSRGLREPDNPDDPKCKKERKAAKKFCAEHVYQLSQGLGHEGFGVTYEQCLGGQVSERCGGNPANREPPRKKVKRWNLKA
jgi:hypothetical protein